MATGLSPGVISTRQDACKANEREMQSRLANVCASS